jgi:hypothetical protein
MPVDGVGGDGRHAEAERGARQALAAAEPSALSAAR